MVRRSELWHTLISNADTLEPLNPEAGIRHLQEERAEDQEEHGQAQRVVAHAHQRHRHACHQNSRQGMSDFRHGCSAHATAYICGRGYSVSPASAALDMLGC